MEDNNTRQWIIGGVVGLFGILGLYVASRAADQVFYWLGLLVFAGCVLVIFLMIKRAYDALGAHRHGQPDSAAAGNAGASSSETGRSESPREDKAEPDSTSRSEPPRAVAGNSPH